MYSHRNHDLATDQLVNFTKPASSDSNIPRKMGGEGDLSLIVERATRSFGGSSFDERVPVFLVARGGEGEGEGEGSR